MFKVWWHAATLFFIYFYIIRADLQYLYILLGEYHSCYPHCFRSEEGLLWGVPSRDSNSGLPYSKPTRYIVSVCKTRALIWIAIYILHYLWLSLNLAFVVRFFLCIFLYLFSLSLYISGTGGMPCGGAGSSVCMDIDMEREADFSNTSPFRPPRSRDTSHQFYTCSNQI